MNHFLRHLIKASPQLRQIMTLSPDLSQMRVGLDFPPFVWYRVRLTIMDGEALQVDYDLHHQRLGDMPSRIKCVLAEGKAIGCSWKSVRISPHVPVKVSVLVVPYPRRPWKTLGPGRVYARRRGGVLGGGAGDATRRLRSGRLHEVVGVNTINREVHRR